MPLPENTALGERSSLEGTSLHLQEELTTLWQCKEQLLFYTCISKESVHNNSFLRSGLKQSLSLLKVLPAPAMKIQEKKAPMLVALTELSYTDTYSVNIWISFERET